MKFQIINFRWQITICFSHPRSIFCTSWIIIFYSFKEKVNWIQLKNYVSQTHISINSCDSDIAEQKIEITITVDYE